MKRTLSLLFLSLVLLVAVSCQAAAPNNFILATGGTSGTYYPYGGAIAQIWNTKVANTNVTAQSTGASVENLRLINKKEAEFAIVQNDVMDYAYKGIEQFTGEKLENIMAVATLYPEVVQIAVTPESGITSIADMAGKRISVGDAGSGVEINARQILEAYGLSFDSIKKANLSFKESGDGMQNGTLDGCFVTAGVPNAALQELATTKELRLISIDDEHVTQLIEKYGFYTSVMIPQDTYKGMNSDVQALAIKATLAVNKTLSETAVYNLTKALFENQPELASAHAKGKELDLNNAVQGISIPYHPGALKYYKEKGLGV